MRSLLPYGRVAAEHRSLEEMNARLASAPSATGMLELIVVRPVMHERICPRSVELRVDEGVRGDRWAQDDGCVGRQVAMIDVRVAQAIADREDWPLLGDNLFVSFDLGADSLCSGDRLQLGGAVLEITDEPHHGCRKLAARFGPRAMRFVNHRDHRAERRRGIYARVVEGGTVAIGDRMERA